MKRLILILVFIIGNHIALSQNFIGSFDLVAGPEDASKKDRNDTLSYYFGENKVALIMHPRRSNQPDLRLVFNPADSTITGLFELNGKKSGYILPMNKKYWPSMDYVTSDYETGSGKQLDITGEKKEINGYQCTGMVCNNDKFEGTFWIANDIKLTLVQIMAYQTVGAGKDTEDLEMLAECGIKGFTMLAKLRLFEKKDVIQLSVVNMSNTFDEAVFNTDEHTLGDMREE